jgi:hypothetical protein
MSAVSEKMDKPNEKPTVRLPKMKIKRGRHALGLPPTEKQLKVLEEGRRQAPKFTSETAPRNGGRPKTKIVREALLEIALSRAEKDGSTYRLKMPDKPLNLDLAILGNFQGAGKGNAACMNLIHDVIDGKLSQTLVLEDEEGRTEADIDGRMKKLEAMYAALRGRKGEK